MKGRWYGVVLSSLALLFAVVPLLVSCAFDGPTPEEPVLEFSTVAWEGIQRTFGMYAPPALLDPAPLVLLLHGGFGSAAEFWETELAESWKALADGHGFLLVLPEGAADEGNPTGHHWNDCRVDLGNLDSMSAEDDVGFIERMIDVIAARVSIDAARIYVTGVSNGGMMTLRLAMQLGSRLAAAAPIIANLPDPSECAFEAAPLPILIMNGTADPVIPYYGGCVLGPSCQRGSVRSTAATVAFWVLANGASVVPVEIALADTVPSDESTITVYRFDEGARGNDVVLYRVDGGGHCAPGPGPLPAEGKNRDIDAATEIWSFFEEHTRGS
jgi:polyhydroxybutyrate depolymerase